MELFTGSSATIGIILAIIYILVKIIEALIKKLGKRESVLTEEEQESLKKIDVLQKKSILTEDEQGRLKSLYDLHNKTDSDGIPIWYVPRTWSDNQATLLDKLTQISNSQERISYVLENIVKHLEKIENIRD